MKPVLIAILLLFSLSAYANKVQGVYSYMSFKVENKRTWFTVTNNYTRTVKCYIWIDGYKKRMRLQPNVTSRWYIARRGYSYTDISWRCDPTANTAG